MTNVQYRNTQPFLFEMLVHYVLPHKAIFLFWVAAVVLKMLLGTSGCEPLVLSTNTHNFT